jgi:activating signal cointegrator complex subunit 3
MSRYSFPYFNPIQTQVFHAVYHTDENIFLGAPTGSGKTCVAELAIFRLLLVYPGLKVVYIAPMKALARERIIEWGRTDNLRGRLGVKIVELTGDSNPDPRDLAAANLLITTPEKWDGVSRNWKTRAFVKQVALVIIDEIHLLGQDRGPVLEVWG